MNKFKPAEFIHFFLKDLFPTLLNLIIYFYLSQDYYLKKIFFFQKLLLKVHNLHTGWFRRLRLVDRAVILTEMDKAIIREGGTHNMPIEALKNACYIRGLNPLHMRTDDMVEWLNKWIAISSATDKENCSLLLHSPILLAYNETSNWSLIYKNK